MLCQNRTFRFNCKHSWILASHIHSVKSPPPEFLKKILFIRGNTCTSGGMWVGGAEGQADSPLSGQPDSALNPGACDHDPS